MEGQKAIIIGAGVAGLAAATRLAVRGYAVEVYEKNEYPGGKLTLTEKDGYRFDAGPSLFTQPQNLEELFAFAGENIHDYFSYQPVDIACRYFYGNGTVVNAYTDAAAFAQEMQDKLQEDPAAIRSYLQQSEKMYNHIGTLFTDQSIHQRKTWLNRRVLNAVKHTRLGYLFNTLHTHNTRQFTKPETVQLFNRFATYNGSNPYKAPGMLSLIPHLEHNEGIFYPAGGMISITNALYQLALKKGVQFHFGKAAERIIHHEGRVRGIVTDNTNKYADVVVSNMDVFFTYYKLLKNPYRSKQLLKEERSSSAFVFYWGMNQSFPQLHLHNIFFSNNYKEEFEYLFSKKTFSPDPTIYINITSKMEQGHAPEGKENWFVMVNAPADTGQNWAELRETLRARVIAKLSAALQTDIEASIETETLLNPSDIETQTASFTGSLYGASSNSKTAAFMRHANFSNTIKGLYFCGGTVHPGGGIPLCLKGAKIVGSLVPDPAKQAAHH
jgi:phytoene desaturase